MKQASEWTMLSKGFEEAKASVDDVISSMKRFKNRLLDMEKNRAFRRLEEIILDK